MKKIENRSQNYFDSIFKNQLNKIHPPPLKKPPTFLSIFKNQEIENKATKKTGLQKTFWHGIIENIFKKASVEKAFAQGTIEYLVIIAIVVVIALVVVSLLLGQMNSASTTNEQSSKLYWSSQPLAITDSIVDDNGTMLIVIKNNTGDWIELKSITINNNPLYPDNLSIANGETKSIHLNKNNISTKNSEITLTYQTKAGLEKTQKGTTNLLTTQTTTIAPSDGTTLLTQNDCFDWNGSAQQHTICTCNDLNTIDYNSTTRGWTYILQNNLDFRNCDPNYTTGEGWNPIGDNATYPFTGNFLGNNKTITGLYVNRPDQNYVSLFGYTIGADVNDIGVIDQNVTGGCYVGGLIGINYNGSRTNNSYSTGDTNGAIYVGGLIGSNSTSSIINNSYSTGNTIGLTYVGGIAGYNVSTSTINNSYAIGDTTSESNYAGGIVGYNYSSSQINNSYSTGNTLGESYTGGISGRNYSSSKINNSFATGIVTGSSYVGGITGYNYSSSRVNNSYFLGQVTGTGTYVGGVVGRNRTATITNSYSTGFVKGTTYPGGLAGYNDVNSIVFNSFSTGTVIGTSYSQGVVGYNPAGSSVINLYWFDSNASDNATTCYYSGDSNCTILSDTNYTLLFDPTTDLYDTNEPFWAFGSDANWTARTDNYPILSWQ